MLARRGAQAQVLRIGYTPMRINRPTVAETAAALKQLLQMKTEPGFPRMFFSWRGGRPGFRERIRVVSLKSITDDAIVEPERMNQLRNRQCFNLCRFVNRIDEADADAFDLRQRIEIGSLTWIID